MIRRHCSGRRVGARRAALAWLLPVLLGPALLRCKEPATPAGPACTISPGDPRYEKVETRCDGQDNDCDLLPDVLLPVEENRCSTGLHGVCATGHAACLDGRRTCLAPAASAEVYDGLDNDCNGVVDDVPPAALRPCRARVLVPPYLWQEEPGIAGRMVAGMEQVGIPYDADHSAADWAAGIKQLSKYSLVLMPGYLIGTTLSTEDVAALRAFVEGGGVLVWDKLLGGDGEPDPSMDLAGLATATKRDDVTELRVEGTTPATLWLDSLEERQLKLTDDPVKAPIEVFLYTAAAESGAVPFSRALAASKDVGTPFMRRPLGRGAVYTLGHSLTEFEHSNCYVNCFDPGADLLALFIRGALRESCGGHYVVKHTVPGPQPSILLVTHDVDAPDSHNAGVWGEPGALQMAKMERSHGVKGVNFVTTDFVAGYYNPDMIRGLCDVGMCPQGGHSVQHLPMTNFKKGDCSITRATYDAKNPTTCGEIRVSIELIKKEVPPGTPLTGWRQPLLEIPMDLFEVLHSEGVRYDASLAMGDMRTNFPMSLARWPERQDWFRGLPLFEFPMNMEDGIGWYENGEERRLEIQRSNEVKFVSLWTNILLQNTANQAWNVLLVHPSYGRGVGPENLPIKIDCVERMILLAQKHGLLVEQIIPAGEFWRGRESVEVEVRASSEDYSGVLRTGQIAAPRFSLEFGDNLQSFSCPGTGPARITGNRVVFEGTLPVKSSLPFTATIKKN